VITGLASAGLLHA